MWSLFGVLTKIVCVQMLHKYNYCCAECVIIGVILFWQHVLCNKLWWYVSSCMMKYHLVSVEFTVNFCECSADRLCLFSLVYMLYLISFQFVTVLLLLLLLLLLNFLFVVLFKKKITFCNLMLDIFYQWNGSFKYATQPVQFIF